MYKGDRPDLQFNRQGLQGIPEGPDTLVYTLELVQQAVVLLAFASEAEGTLTVFAPCGGRVKGSATDGKGGCLFAFAADQPGSYRIQFQTIANQAVGSCRLTLKQCWLTTDRVSPVPAERLESRLIQKLRRNLLVQPKQALEEFWQEIDAQGTPLQEEHPDHPGLRLCTFVWRSMENISNIRIHLLFRTALPNDYFMKHIEQTDVWYTTVQLPARGRYAYQIQLNVPPGPPPDMDSSPEYKLMYFASAQLDPFNPRRCFDEHGSRYEGLSLLEMPDAPAQPWTAQRPAIERGNISRSYFFSSLLQDERPVAVYTPPGYSGQAGPYGLMFVFDEQWFLTRVPTATILDNLLADKAIPPLVAVIIGNGPGEARSRQLPCNPLFADFMASELLPWVKSRYPVTENPARIIVAGASYGGLAASYVALRRPEVFGQVLSLSGSYWWTPPGKNIRFAPPHPQLVSLYLQQPKLPLQFYLTAGIGEIDLSGCGRSILTTNRYLRDVFLAKGYEVRYEEFVGGHDFLSWRGKMAEGLRYLTASWQSNND